jgi:hypothetical protein
MSRNAELSKGIGKSKQTKTGTLRHNARLAQKMLNGERPSSPVGHYNLSRGTSGESSN